MTYAKQHTNAAGSDAGDTQAPKQGLTRRDALRLLLAVGGMGLGANLFGMPRLALADTASDLADAEARLADAQEELAIIAADYEELSQIHSETLAQIDAVRADIAATQAEIERKQAELDMRRGVLSRRVSSAYKAGGDDFLRVLLESSSFEQLISNIYYLDKITEADSSLIETVESLKNELIERREYLDGQRVALEELSASEETQLADMRAKQAEAETLITNLDAEVQELIKKRDEELAAQAAAAAAAAAARAGRGAVVDLSGMTGSQAAVINAAYVTPTPGVGLCAMWVSQVFSNAGYAYVSGDACDMYSYYCYTSDRSQLVPGMIVACSTHPHTWAGRIWGHVGIYIGSGVVMDNIGYIRTIDLDSWIDFYGATVPVRWGWLGGMVLA